MGTETGQPIVPAPIEPTPLPTEAAAAAVREAMAGGMDLATAVEKVGAEGGQPRVPPGRPEGGQWTEKPPESPVTPEKVEAAPTPAPEAGDPGAKPEGDQPPQTPTPEDGTPPAEEAKVFVIEGEGDTPAFEIPIEDEETFERLSALQTALTSAQERVAGIDAERATLSEQFNYIDDIDAVMSADPAGYLLQRIEDNPEIVKDVVLSLLVQDGVWERVGREVMSLDSPQARQVAQARVIQQRADAQDNVRAAVKVNRNYRALEREVARLTPKHLTGEARAMFAYDALGDLQRFAESNGLQLLPEDKVGEILKERIGLYDKAPADGGQPAEAQPAPKPTLRGKQRTGAEFVAAQEQRRALAGAGAGGEPVRGNGLTPPEGLGIDETVEWHRRQMREGRQVMTGLSQ